ncbi:hypothetical protein HY224_02285 [Candidatus Uhrbacteria bacterium]|nr:hypothetical protein [Candidatus Uhrbacteria bacterium]
MNFSSNSSLIKTSEILKLAKPLQPYIDELKSLPSGYTQPESFINLVLDQEALQTCKKVRSSKVTDKLKYLVVVGIGGSYLGTKALYDALFGFSDALEPDRWPKIIFVDTFDPELLTILDRFLGTQIVSPEEILINIVAKSGTTNETVVNADLVLQKLSRKFKNFDQRVVVATAYNSPMWRLAKLHEISLLEIPSIINGRYTVFTPVGLFPLAVLGVDVQSFMTGGQKMLSHCLADTSENLVALSAAIIYKHYQAGVKIHDHFFFHPELESLGKWTRQLVAESLGEKRKGKNANVGVTPTVSVGTNDLHSMVQLYLSGPYDKFTTFINAPSHANLKVQNSDWAKITDHLSGKSISEIMSATFEGVKRSYIKCKRPFAEITLSGITAQGIGEYMMFKMLETIYLAKLLKVNAFDQPEVDDYKAETRKILSS